MGIKIVDLGIFLLVCFVFLIFFIKLLRFLICFNFFEFDNSIIGIGVFILDFLYVVDKLEFVFMEFFFIVVNRSFLFLLSLGELLRLVVGLLGINVILIFLGIWRDFKGLCCIVFDEWLEECFIF